MPLHDNPLLARHFSQPHEYLYPDGVASRTEDGFPILGTPDTAAMLTRQEREAAVIVPTYHTQMFCLWNPADQALYAQIMQNAATGEFAIKVRREFLVTTPDIVKTHPGGHIKVWLEWVQYSGILPSRHHIGEPNAGTPLIY